MMNLNRGISILSLFFLVIFAGCNNDKPVEKHNALWKEIDILKQKYSQSYINCPDSAEKIAFRMLYIFDSMGEDMERLNTYDKLSDLYQYRKKDDIKALDCMTKALEIYSKHPDLPLENPYFFINNANILYRNKLYDHAIELYKQSYTIAKDHDCIFATSLALSNIGLVYRELGKYPLAINYLHKSINIIQDPDDLVRARYYYYLASVFFKLKQTDSIDYYCRKSKRILDVFERDSLYIKVIDKESFAIAFYETKSDFYKLMAEREILNNHLENGIGYYKQSLQSAKLAGSESRLSEVYFDLSRSYLQFDNLQMIENYADSAMRNAKSVSNISLQLDISKFLTSYFTRKHDAAKRNYYISKSESLKDSIIQISLKDEIVQNKIILASSPLILSMKNLKQSQMNYQSIIKQQYYIIALLIVVIVMLVIIRLIIYYQKRKVHQINKQLVKRTSEVLELEDQLLTSNSVKRNDQLLERLEQLMKSEMYFLDSGLTLAELSGKLNTNQTYLSQLINQHYGVNFNDYINELRIKEACKHLNSDEYRNYKIEYLAEIVGFKGTSTFYTAFKKFTGVSPSTYKKLSLDAVKNQIGMTSLVC